MSLFDEGYKSAGDWELWLRAYEHGSAFMYIPNGSGLFYINPRGLSTGRAAEGAVREAGEIKQLYAHLLTPKNVLPIIGTKCCKDITKCTR